MEISSKFIVFNPPPRPSPDYRYLTPMKSLRSIAPIILLALLALAGCGKHEEQSGAAFTVKDDLGREVAFTARPQRIVSLAPSFTEILYAIGADTLVAGVSSYCNYPAEAAGKPRVGSLTNPSIEAIVALQPDLALVTAEGNTEGTYLQLEKLGVRTFASNPNNLADVLRSIRTLGRITGCAPRADALADSLHALLAPPPARSDTPTVLMVLSAEPLIAAGSNTFLGEMIALAGARNAVQGLEESAAAESRYPVISRELIVQRNPDIILVPTDMGVGGEYLKAVFPEWKNVSAIRRNAVYLVDGDVFMRPGPRLWQGLDRLKTVVQ